MPISNNCEQHACTGKDRVSAVVRVTGSGVQKVDVHALIKDIRSAAEVGLPEWSFVKGGESGPGATGDFFAVWKRDSQDFERGLPAI
jgi:hypothetical protein